MPSIKGIKTKKVKVVQKIIKTSTKKTNPKTSHAAEAVAREVIDTVRKGKIPNKGKISVKHGYTKASAKANKAVRTRAYQKTIEPFVDQLKKERQRIITAMQSRDLDEVEYKDLSAAMEKLFKQIQLLDGGDTDRFSFVIEEMYSKL